MIFRADSICHCSSLPTKVEASVLRMLASWARTEALATTMPPKNGNNALLEKDRSLGSSRSSSRAPSHAVRHPGMQVVTATETVASSLSRIPLYRLETSAMIIITVGTHGSQGLETRANCARAPSDEVSVRTTLTRPASMSAWAYASHSLVFDMVSQHRGAHFRYFSANLR